MLGLVAFRSAALLGRALRYRHWYAGILECGAAVWLLQNNNASIVIFNESQVAISFIVYDGDGYVLSPYCAQLITSSRNQKVIAAIV